MDHCGSLKKIAVSCGIFAGLFVCHSAQAALSLQTSFSISETYTDNLFFENVDTEEDFGTLFGPNFNTSL